MDANGGVSFNLTFILCLERISSRCDALLNQQEEEQNLLPFI